jgi:glutamate dehydrogenase/leucine dehydrogenase
MAVYSDPEYIIHVHDPVSGMRGVIVLDSTVRGPAKGGIRMATSVDEHEVRGLARAMTLKTALADLPFGGGKSGIIADPKKLSKKEKEVLVRAFAEKLRVLAPAIYVAAPDIAMAEEEMRWIADVAGPKAITGKPTDLGGIPHELGSTGWGVFIAGREALRIKDIPIKGATVAVQGFGNVGSFAAKYFAEAGALLIAASDSSATLTDPAGLPVDELIAWKEARKSFADFPHEQKHDAAHVTFVACDVLVPAAQKHIITETNYEHVKAKIIVQGANLPVTDEAEVLLAKRGVVNVPDILANAGGVISSYVEHIGGKESDVFALIEKTIVKNMHAIETSITHPEQDAREACVALAQERLHPTKRVMH